MPKFYAEPGTILTFADPDHTAREIEFPKSGHVTVEDDDSAAIDMCTRSHAVSDTPPKEAKKE